MSKFYTELDDLRASLSEIIDIFQEDISKKDLITLRSAQNVIEKLIEKVSTEE